MAAHEVPRMPRSHLVPPAAHAKRPRAAAAGRRTADGGQDGDDGSVLSTVSADRSTDLLVDLSLTTTAE